jgi:hypothetical protein
MQSSTVTAAVLVVVTVAADAHPLFSCVSGTDHFTSTQADCEGRQLVGSLGSTADAAAGATTAPLYRCYNGKDHLDSSSGVVVAVVGAASVNLTGGANTITTTASTAATYALCPAGYTEEELLGNVYKSAGAAPGTTALYRCIQSGDHFSSLDPACGGKTVEGMLGYVVAPSPAPSPMVIANDIVSLTIDTAHGCSISELHVVTDPLETNFINTADLGRCDLRSKCVRAMKNAMLTSWRRQVRVPRSGYAAFAAATQHVRRNQRI